MSTIRPSSEMTAVTDASAAGPVAAGAPPANGSEAAAAAAGGSDAERELVERARAGDQAALEALIVRIEPMVYRFGLKLCGHPEDAKGVLQETLITLVRSLDGFRGESSLATWLYTVARSHCLKKRRRSKFAPAHIDSLEAAPQAAANVASDDPDPAQDLERRRLEAALDAAIRRLDEKYRDVLVLRDIEGLSGPEVAAVTGLGLAAVKSRLHRARAALKRDIERILGDARPAAIDRGRACPNIVELLSRKLEGELSAEICAQAEEHVNQCPRCRVECDVLRRTLAICASTPAPVVPKAVQDEVRRAARAALRGAG